MKHFVKNSAVWLLLLSMLLCIFASGCESKPAAGVKRPNTAGAKIPEKTQLEVQADAELYYENMYRFYPCRKESDDVRWMNLCGSYDGYIYGCGRNERDHETHVLQFDSHGKQVSDQMVKGFPNIVIPVNDSQYISMINKGADGGMFMIRNEEDGTVSQQSKRNPIADPPGTPFANSEYGKTISNFIIYLDEDCILAGFYYDLYIFTSDFKQEPVYVDLPGAISGVERLDDHTILMFSPFKVNETWESLFHTIDMATGEVKPYPYDDAHPDPEKLFENIEKLYYHEKAYYACCKDGIYCWRDGEIKLLLDWKESYMDSSYIEICQIISDDCFLVRIPNRLTWEEEFGYLIRETVQREKPREVVTIASQGIPMQLHFFIQSAVDNFNRESPDYLIYYHCYEDYDSLSESHYGDIVVEEAQQAFEMDIINGIVYDCYLFPDGSKNHKMFADKNALLDLTPYISEGKLLGCVESAYETEKGKLGLPLFFQLSTLVTTQNTLLANQRMTWDVLYDFAEKLQPGESLFDDMMFQRLTEAGTGSFIDPDGKTCNFESEEYIRYLEFLKEIKEGKYYDPSVTVMLYRHPEKFDEYDLFYSSNTYALAGLDAQKKSLLGKLKFSFWDITSTNALDALMLAYHQQNINYCGYPGKEGTSILMSANAVFQMTSIANCPDGAAAFMDYLYSDFIQACDAVSGFGLPVTRDAIKAVFPHDYACYVVQDTYVSDRMDPDDGDAIIFRAYCRNDPNEIWDKFQVVRVTEDDCDKFIRFLDRAKSIRISDKVIRNVVDEEISYFVGGTRSAEDCANIIQNRLYIYINE